jgi:hypothetical protein
MKVNFKVGDYIRMYTWPEGKYYKVIWIDTLGDEVCLSMTGVETTYPIIGSAFWYVQGERTYKNKGEKPVSTKEFNRAIVYRRGKDYQVTVGVNIASDHISYQDLKVPDNATEAVTLAFLDEAEQALSDMIDAEWEKKYAYTDSDKYYTGD